MRWQADDNQSIIYLLLNISKNKSLRKKVYMSKTCQAHLCIYGSLTRTNKEDNLHKLTDSLNRRMSKKFQWWWQLVLPTVPVELIYAAKPFKSAPAKGMSWASRPVIIRQVYLDAEPPPALQKLNEFRFVETPLTLCDFFCHHLCPLVITALSSSQPCPVHSGLTSCHL